MEQKIDPRDARIAELEAARFAYASEFEPNADGDPDVGSIHANIRALKAQLSAIGAGGVEPLRKPAAQPSREMEGQKPRVFADLDGAAPAKVGERAALMESYAPSELFGKHSIHIGARTATAQPSRECLQQSVESAVGSILGAAYDFRDAHICGSTNEKAGAHAALESTIRAALEAAPPAPAGVAVPAVPTAEMLAMAKGYGLSERALRGIYAAFLAAAPMQPQDDRAAFKAYLQECDDCEIVADVAGAFNAGWTAAAHAPAQAVAVPHVFALCESVEAQNAGATEFERGMRTAAKRIRKEVNTGGPAQEHATQLAGPALRPYIGHVQSVADLVNNLLLLDQTLPIYGAQYIEHPPGKRRAIAVPPTVSREQVKDSRWIGEGDTLNAAVIWTRAEQPAAPIQAQEDATAWPQPGDLVRYDRGPTALALHGDPHAGGWHGVQCMGGYTYYHRTERPSDRDRETWTDCAVLYRGKSMDEARREAGLEPDAARAAQGDRNA